MGMRLVLLAVLLVLPACSSETSDQLDSHASRIEELERNLDLLSNSRDALQREVDELKSEVEELRRSTDDEPIYWDNLTPAQTEFLRSQGITRK